jgi:hypothetical protein
MGRQGLAASCMSQGLWTLAIALGKTIANTAWATPTATISAPTVTTTTTTNDTTDVTFSGSVSSGTTILHAAYGVFDSASGTVVESLITGGTTFSVTVTLDATTFAASRTNSAG